MEWFKVHRIQQKPNGNVAFSGLVEANAYYIGEIIEMPIDIEHLTTPINAVQSDLGYDPNSFELIDFNTNASFANIFIQKYIDNNKGFARLTGGLPNPGFSGEKGIFAIALLKPKRSGLLTVYFLPTSMILANDGNATNLLRDNYTASFTVRNEVIPADKLKEQENKYLRKSGMSINADPHGEYLEFTEGAVLGASTSNELEQASKAAVRHERRSWLYMFDALVVRLWFGWAHIYK